MSVFSNLDEETKQVLNDVKDLRDITKKIDKLRKQLEKGNLHYDEYKELVNDVLDLDKVAQFADDLELKIKIVKAAKILIKVASAAV